MMSDVRIATGDGQTLHATAYLPEPAPASEPAQAWLLINSATGVRRRFYRQFALHLMGLGIGVMTYDYRGIGDSVVADATDVRLEDWGRKDFTAVLHWLRTSHQSARVVVLGHSVGGQLVGISPAVNGIDGLVGVASQSGRWRHWSGLERAKLFTFWYAAIPLLTTFRKTFPASYFGLGGDLPAGVARQWAERGRDRDYIRSPSVGPQPQFYDEVRCRLRTYLVGHDNFAPERAVRAWHDWFPNAEREFVNLGVRNSEGRRIGHFGFFDPEIGAGEWPALAEFVRG